MSDIDKTNTENEIEAGATEAPGNEQATGGKASGWGSQEAAGAADAERIAALEAENADIKDRMLRIAAEMENLRRRTARELHDSRQYAVASFARDMLQVADNLRRAIESIPAEARDAGNAGLDSLVEGVEMTERGFLATMEKHGVRKLEPEGQRFDPNFHQAMFEVPNTEVPNGTVVQVVQAGYAIGERVLRPAMVGVSKGGPKPGAEPKAESPAEPANSNDTGNGAA
ncbi:nucleotide exchange factor GrpE [Consotaella salsifontis]|uniref:Protein GrpE n=1 Tax=Consotaella salsifontis TaxID=1365950 RepID=A0A1T4QQ00_9HYPH|nr:nucleotide exchange factor GrpE [Consotaella salsifontis]SKA05766.1 molecular chaperone GrpE [Consotaella salsifontis]